MPSLALHTAKWTLDIATKLVKAKIRLHNTERLTDDMSIVFVVNHFTRLETLLLPYVFNKATGRIVWSLAAADLFVGRVGSFLRQTCNISTKDPERDNIIVKSLLKGDNPWLIFPEGAMVKDKKVIDPSGMFEVYSRKGERRPPHSGAAVFALRAEFYRHKLACLVNAPGQEKNVEAVLERFELDNPDRTLSKFTVIVPVNITYYPIRAGENIFLRVARALSKGELSARALDELSVEGTVLSSDTDIDITLGDPIDVREYLFAPEYSEIVACGLNDMALLESDPRSMFNEATRRLMVRYMSDIYRLTTVNYDHIFATLIRYQNKALFSEREYRNRIFLCVHQIKQMGHHRLHNVLDRTYRDIIYEDPSPKFQDFIDLCVKEGIIKRESDRYFKDLDTARGTADFQTIRSHELTWVIANEIEPLAILTGMVRNITNMDRSLLSKKIRDIFLREDAGMFMEDYEKYFIENESKPKEIGEPFLLVPEKIHAGVVLVHGYLAAPTEVRALAEFLYAAGYAVYVVRLKGHGTAPEDLAETTWEDWYESVNRGYVVIKSLTDEIVLGGFSTGGLLALYGAAQKGQKIRAVFAVNAPLQLKNFYARFAGSLVAMNSLLRKVRRGRGAHDFVEHTPENEHINYVRNPLRGVQELGRAMEALDGALARIEVPTLIIQANEDPVVNPVSGQLIFDKVGTKKKELTMLNRDRHGIINGAGADQVFERIKCFLSYSLAEGSDNRAGGEAVTPENRDGPGDAATIVSA